MKLPYMPNQAVALPRAILSTQKARASQVLSEYGLSHHVPSKNLLTRRCQELNLGLSVCKTCSGEMGQICTNGTSTSQKQEASMARCVSAGHASRLAGTHQGSLLLPTPPFSKLCLLATAQTFGPWAFVVLGN